jgi:pro-kumamolisin-like protein/IPT/TIG domain-containing protein
VNNLLNRLLRLLAPVPDTGQRVLRRVLRILLLGALVAPLGAQSPDAVRLPGHVAAALSRATRLAHDPRRDTETLYVTVALKLSDPQGAAAFEEEYSNPASPGFHQSVTPQDFSARFGPSQSAWDTVRAYLENSGLVVQHDTGSRRLMIAQGTRVQLEKAFGVVIDDYRLGERTFHAVASDPLVPAAIAKLVGNVAGLSNLARGHSAYVPNPVTPPMVGAAYNGILGSDLPPGLDGSSQTVGLVSFDAINPQDLSDWLAYEFLPPNLIDHYGALSIYGSTAPSGCTQATSSQCGTVEQLLDVTAVMAVAPGAKIFVYQAPPGTDWASVIEYAINNLAYSRTTSGAVLAVTTIDCEDSVNPSDAETIDGLASEAMVYNTAVFAGTGDTGSVCGDGSPSTIAAPSDSPHVVAVGGTILHIVSDLNYTYQGENWWNTPGIGAGGFGVSTLFPQPTFQAKLRPGALGRSVPDVAMTVGPWPYCQTPPGTSTDCSWTVGGTSLATPLFAAIWAIAQQGGQDAGGAIFSPANGYFYRHPAAFHAPSTLSGAGNDFAHVGLGSPKIADLVAIAVPPRIDSFSPANGAGSGGTKVTVLGAGFIGVSKVSAVGVDGIDVHVESDRKLTFVTQTAPFDRAMGAIRVVTPGGTASSPAEFDYNPKIVDVVPNTGPMEGGAALTVFGYALTNSTVFEFGDAAHTATNVSCAASSGSGYCNMKTPAHVPSATPIDVYALSPWYTLSPVVATDKYTFLLPAITGITPLTASGSESVLVVIQGVSLDINHTTVNFGTTKVTTVPCSGTTACIVASPLHAPGSVPVTVTVNGYTSAPFAQEFTFK